MFDVLFDSKIFVVFHAKLKQSLTSSLHIYEYVKWFLLLRKASQSNKLYTVIVTFSTVHKYRYRKSKP